MATVHCEWGENGVLALRDRCKVLVIVDVLSFGTALDVAVGRGARVWPFPYGDERAAAAEAARLGARLASPRREAELSLSPPSLQVLEPGERLLLPSPNGSRLSLMAGGAIVLSACLRNAPAVAAAARRLAAGGDIGVVPAGERWGDASLRPALEDQLGAGALIASLDLEASAEAEAAASGFRSARPRLPDLIRECVSARELIARGHAADVEIALDSDVSPCAPVLRDGAYEDAASFGSSTVTV